MSLLRRCLLGMLLLAITPFAFAAGELPPLPPLNDPPSEQRHPGKFIWADLFASDLDGVRAFYSTVFGWEWRWIVDSPEHRYGMFYNGDEAVAGLAEYRPPDVTGPYARWVHFISVADVGTTVGATVAGGGRELLARRAFADRGDYAILADREHAPFGVLRSSSGDPGDYQVQTGDWLWVQLFSRDPRSASAFYAELLGYEVFEPDEYGEVVDFVLASDGHSRAAIGQLKEKSEAQPQWLGFIRVKNPETVMKRARENGGEVLLEPRADIAGGDLAIIADSLGTPVGLMRWSYADTENDREGAR